MPPGNKALFGDPRTGTYAAYYKVNSVDGWGWDQVKTEIIWRMPSHSSLSTAYEIFDAQLSCHEKKINRLISEYPWKSSNAFEHKDGLHGLADSLNGADELFSGIASLLDPQLASTNMDSDEASRMAWHTREIQPSLRNTKMHERRSNIAQLAARVNKLLVDGGENSTVCFEAILELFITLVRDVGTCQEHRAIGMTRKDRDLWAFDFRVRQGIRPHYPPAFQVLDLNQYHVNLQEFATLCRGMGDVEEAAVAVLVDGCCSPFESVFRLAKSALEMSLNMIMGFACHFLPPMLKMTIELVAEYNISSNKSLVPRILNALGSLLAGQAQRLEKPVLWARDCPFSVPELVQLIMEAVKTQNDEILKLALSGLRQLEQTPWESRAFPYLRYADTIRPAHEDPEAIQKALQSREAYRADIAMRMRDVGLQMLEKARDQQHYNYIWFARTIFVGFAQNPHPAEYVSVLADGVVSKDIRNQHACMMAFADLIKVCLAKSVYGDDVEAYVRTQGRKAGLIKVDPHGNKDEINRILEKFRETEATDMFVDNMSVGSLVWSEFEAVIVDPLIQIDSKTVGRLVVHFTQDWFRKLVRILQQEELPEVARAWTSHDNSMVPSTFSSHDNIGDGPHNDIAETYQNFVENQLALKVPELLVRILNGIQQQRSHKASTSSTNSASRDSRDSSDSDSSDSRARRTRRVAMGMLRMFYLRHLLSSNPEEQLSIQLTVWTQIWDKHVEMRVDAYLTLRDILRRSCRNMAQGFAQKLIVPGKALLRSKGSAAERKRHMGVLWLGIACTSFPDIMQPESWMVEAAEALSHIAVSRDSTFVGQDARRCLQNFQEDRRSIWADLKLSEDLKQNFRDMKSSSHYA